MARPSLPARVLVFAAVLLVGSVSVGAAEPTPSPSLAGVWVLDVYCGATICNTAVETISIGGTAQEEIDPDCSPKVYCITTPNTSGPGNFWAKGVSLTPNGSGSWTQTCTGCTGYGTFTGVFKGDTFTGTTMSSGNPARFKVTMTMVSAPAASLSVEVTAPPIPESWNAEDVAIGQVVGVTVKVTASGSDFKDVSLTKGGVVVTICGSESAGDGVVVTYAPPLASGFPLDEGTSRTFEFKVRGRRRGENRLHVNVRGETTAGAMVDAQGSTSIQVGAYGVAPKPNPHPGTSEPLDFFCPIPSVNPSVPAG